jgi:hypothetical protein
LPLPETIADIIFVDVVLPFVPLITTTPSGSVANIVDKNEGLIFSTIKPGSAAPRLPKSRNPSNVSLPIHRLKYRILYSVPCC